jgi:hypothetical protein
MTLAVNIAQSGSSNVTFRNRIINGAMVIDQRNAGASVTPTSGTYTLDRYVCYLTQASKFTVQQNAGSVTPPAGFTNYLGVTSSSAYSVISSDEFNINQPIEGFNVADLAWGTANAKTVTLSFWVRSSLTGTFGGCLRNGATNRSYPFSYTISAANTWEYETITIAGDTTGTWATNNTTGLFVTIGLGNGSSTSNTAGAWAAGNFTNATGATSVVGTNGATFYITGVQLEAGTTASPFEYRQYGTELALCQRYFYKVFDANVDFQAIGTRDSATNAWINIATPASMRTNPTLGVPSGYGRIILYDTSFTLAIPAISSMGIQSAGTSQFHINFAIASSAGSYVFTSYDTSGTSTALTLSAEL